MMDKTNKFVFDKEQKDLELKLENDNITLKEQILKLQETIKKMKSEVVEYGNSIEASDNQPPSKSNVKTKQDKASNGPKSNPIDKPPSKREIDRNNQPQSKFSAKLPTSKSPLEDQQELLFSTNIEKPVEQGNKNHNDNQNKKKTFNSEEDEVRFSFNNDQYKNKFMSIETNLALPNKYLEAEVSMEKENNKNQAINPNTQREIKEESKIEYSYASNFTRTKGNSWKVKDGETVKSSPIPPKENTKMFNFADSSDDNEENFFSSPKLNNLQVDSRNLLPSLKEKRSDVNKSFKSQQTNNQDKHGRENSFKVANPEKETKQLDTLNNTKKSVKNVTSPKVKKTKDADTVKSKAVNKKDTNAKKKVPAPNKKNLTRSLSRSRSKSRKKVFRKNISEQFNDNKKEKSIITNTTTQNDKSNLSNVNNASYANDKDKQENEKLKEENKRLKEENTLLRKLLEKERQKNEKFNNLAEEFIKFYEKN